MGQALAGRVLAGVAAALLGVTTCHARPYNPNHLGGDAISRVSGLCSSLMGLSPGEEHFENCVESLSDIQVNIGQARALAQAQDQCRVQGLPEGSPELAECELRVSRQGGGKAEPIVPGRTPEPVSTSSYFLAAPTDVYGREELSCARLGLEPGGAAFQGCVARLQSALLSADIPAQ